MNSQNSAESVKVKTDSPPNTLEEKELRLIARAAGEFAKKILAPNRETNDRYPFGPFFSEVVEKAFELDFFHILLPEDMNGHNQGVKALAAVLENISREDSSLAGIIFTTTAAQKLILHAHSGHILSRLCRRNTVWDFLIAFPVFNNPTEVKHLTKAEKREDDYLLSGTLEYLALGNIAGHALIPARTQHSDGFSYFIVDLKDNGVIISEAILSLGLHGCPAVDITFDQTKAILIGRESLGSLYFDKMSNLMHAAAAAMSVGIMKGSFQEALDYAKKREQGGRPIVRWSELKMLLAKMALNIKNAEMLLAQANQMVDSRSPKWEIYVQSAALHIQELACDVTTTGIQVLGGVGYMKDFGQEKRFRDAKHIQALLGIPLVKKIKLLDPLIH